MRNAQIKRLRSLKKKIDAGWLAGDTLEPRAVLADVEALVDILLMEREGHDESALKAGVRMPAVTTEDDLKAMAALCLHGQPFGFTRDLLARLRYAPTIASLYPDRFVIKREDLKILMQSRTEAADRIEASIPPEDG